MLPHNAADDAASQPSIERARKLLSEALEVIDALDLPADIGARVQHVIDMLEDAETAD